MPKLERIPADTEEKLCCVFEEWDRKRHRMATCSKPAVCKVGKAPLCKEHGIYAAKLSRRITCGVSIDRFFEGV